MDIAQPYSANDGGVPLLALKMVWLISTPSQAVEAYKMKPVITINTGVRTIDDEQIAKPVKLKLVSDLSQGA